MAFLRLVQLLVCLGYLSQTSVYAAKQTCGCPDANNEALFTDMPCQECPDGYYRTCDRGSYYAHHPTMCIYASRQDYTHDEARLMCMKRDVSGFPAFVTDREESYDISHYVWNMLKNGVEGNETFFWVGGKLELITRANKPQKVVSFKYRDYEANVPEELKPRDIEEALREGRNCLAGHTEKHTTLHARFCDEKLPAVCYNYRQRPKRIGACKQEPGKQWVFYRGKCYYVYSARSEREKKTYFDAQRECAAMNSILATVTDDATFKRALELATGLEKIVDIDDGTWIGLQLSGRGYGGSYYYANGTKRDFEKIRKYDPEKIPEMSPGQTEGWWEDGTRYDDVALKHFWAHMVDWVQDFPLGPKKRRDWDQPNEEQLRNPRKPRFEVGECSDYPEKIPAGYNRDRCEKDKFQHCTQIFPRATEEIPNCPDCKAYGYKWNDRWCYYLQRGYICQRDAVFEKDLQRMNDEL